MQAFLVDNCDLFALAAASVAAVIAWGMRETPDGRKRLALLVGMLALLIWAWGNDLLRTRTYWDNPKYSHGVLQTVATIASTYCLQTIGIPTYSDGNRIVVGGEFPMGVVDACSGLRMLTVVTALAAAVAMITDRPIWERIVIIVSAVPIAV